MSRSIDECLEWGASQLREIAERPRREAEILLQHALGKDQLYVITHLDEMVEIEPYESYIIRRAEGEPVEYITQKASFFSQDFYTAPGALIPRPETEILIEQLLESVDINSTEQIVEVGVGSGIISIVLAQHLPQAKILATDISDNAIEVAKVNIDAKGMSERIELMHTDLLAGVDVGIDILVSNPPYIADDIVLEKPLGYEPQNALYGGKVGDEILRRLIEEAFERKVRILACEMGYDQKDKIADYLDGRDYSALKFYKDYEGHDRGFILMLR